MLSLVEMRPTPALQEDPNEDIIDRVPIALAGLNCTGSEQGLDMCPAFQLGEVQLGCRRDRMDVALVCFNGPNPGAVRNPLSIAQLMPRP